MTTLYYGFLSIMMGKAPGAKLLMISTYKAFTPWVHPVGFTNFFVGAVATSVLRLIKDGLTVMSYQKLSDYWLCAFAMYPSFIRVAQCYKKFKIKHEYYPHMTGAVINLMGMVGVWLHAKEVTAAKSWLFWLLFCWRLVEISIKIYWDIWEDAGLFHGGNGAREFKKSRAKW